MVTNSSSERKILSKRSIVLVAFLACVVYLDLITPNNALDRGLKEEEDGVRNVDTIPEPQEQGDKTQPHLQQGTMMSPSGTIITGKPIMHTFFEPTKRPCCGMTEEGHLKLLQTWEESWQARGWETKILTKDDAMKNPNFQMVQMEKLRPMRVNPHNQRGFWRWLAMAAVEDQVGAPGGGGWYSDYDVFPLNLDSEVGMEIAQLPGFKSYNGHVPSIIHAPGEAWDKVLTLMLDVLPVSKGGGRPARTDTMIDMNLLLGVYWNSGEKKMGVTEWKLESVAFPYELSASGDLAINCDIAREAKVAHLSPRDSIRAYYNEKIYPKLDGLEKNNVLERRGEAAATIMRNYGEQCLLPDATATASRVVL